MDPYVPQPRLKSSGQLNTFDSLVLYVFALLRSIVFLFLFSLFLALYFPLSLDSFFFFDGTSFFFTSVFFPPVGPRFYADGPDVP